MVVERGGEFSSAGNHGAFALTLQSWGASFLQKHELAEKLGSRGLFLTKIATNRINAEGKLSRSEIEPASTREEDHSIVTTRGELVQLLREAAVPEAEGGIAEVPIKCLEGWELKYLERHNLESGLSAKATLRNMEDHSELVLYPSLVVGADGINSEVRHALSRWARKDAFSSWESRDQEALEARERFDMERLKTKVASRFKGLRFKPNFRVSRLMDREAWHSEGYSYRSVDWTRDKENGLELVFPPQSRSMDCRIGILRAPAINEFWETGLSSESGVKGHLQERFPQIPWDEVVTQESLEEFRRAEGGYICGPEHIKGSTVFVLGESDKDEAPAAGVVLVGDAVHSFPPDDGIGVEAGMKDAMSLGKALKGYGQSRPQALKDYDAEATAEAHSVVKLANMVHRYKGQPGISNRIRSLLSSGNRVLRAFLSRLPLFGGRIFHPHYSTMLRDVSLSFQQAYRRTRRTTVAICTTVFAALLVASGMGAGLEWPGSENGVRVGGSAASAMVPVIELRESHVGQDLRELTQQTEIQKPTEGLLQMKG